MTLLEDLAAIRRTPEEFTRPIIFVCHSIGGWVVEAALHISSVMERPDLRIIEYTSGIVFIGTPHFSNDTVSWASLLRNFEKLTGRTSNKTFTQSTSRDFESSEIQSISRAFVEIAHRFEIYSIAEETAIPAIGKIVGDDLSVLRLANVNHLSIPANHVEMSQFSRPDEIGYKRLAGAIASLKRAASKMMEVD